MAKCQQVGNWVKVMAGNFSLSLMLFQNEKLKQANKPGHENHLIGEFCFGEGMNSSHLQVLLFRRITKASEPPVTDVT
jgi:hypothetical protein